MFYELLTGGVCIWDISGDVCTVDWFKGDRIMGGAIKQEGHLVAVEICTGGYLEIYCSSMFYGIELYKFIAWEEIKRGGEFRELCSILFDQIIIK